MLLAVADPAAARSIIRSWASCARKRGARKSQRVRAHNIHVARGRGRKLPAASRPPALAVVAPLPGALWDS